MKTEDNPPVVPMIMQIGSFERRRAANTNAAPRRVALRANDTVLIGDLLIYVKSAQEESEETGESFASCLVSILVDEFTAAKAG